MACAWHRQVRLASRAAAKHTPRKRQQEQHGKPSKTGLPKKICNAKIFWEEETQRSKTGGLPWQAAEKRSLRRRESAAARSRPR